MAFYLYILKLIWGIHK